MKLQLCVALVAVSALLYSPATKMAQATVIVKTNTGNGADGYIWNNAAGVLVGGATSLGAASHAMFTRYRPSSNYRLEIIVLRFDMAGITLNDITGASLTLTADMPNVSTPPATSTVMKTLLFHGLDPTLAGQDWDESMLNYGTFPGMLPPDTNVADGFDQGFNPALWTLVGSSPAAEYLNGTHLTVTSPELTTFVKSPGTLKTIAFVYDPNDPADGGSALAQFGSKESLQYSLPDGPDEDAELDIVVINAGDIAPFLTLEGVNPPMNHPGDFDLDGDVDGADFVAWQTNFPKATGAILAEGDADADGDVDGADFVVWQTNFPFTPGPGASPVPEPSCICLLAFGSVLVASRCRKRLRFCCAELLAASVAVSLVAGSLLAGQAQAGLVYWQNFDAGNGTPAVTPTAGGGILALTGVEGEIAFSSTGGIFGGSLDASGNVARFGTGLASTENPGGTPISGLPDQTGGSGPGSMNQFTITFWAKEQSLPTSGGTTGRLVILGSAGTADGAGATAINSFAMTNRNGTTASPNTNVDVFLKNVQVSNFNGTNLGVGNNIVLDEWTFVAVTYDGTSALGNDSTIQSAATAGASMINGQLYMGTNTVAVTRTEVPVTGTPGDATVASLGVVNFGDAAVLLLANRFGGARALDGWLDDIRVYDSVLTASQVEMVRLQGLTGTAGHAGDFDGDGDVDGADFVAWQTNFPKASGAILSEGDADGDGDVDGADFVVWQTNFPFTPGPGAAPIPEPTAGMLAAFGGLICALGISRSRGKQK